jgi:altronate dehydratase small subunit
MKRVAILLHPKDDVATALTALQAEQRIEVSLESVVYTTVLAEDIEFGHKYALRDIKKGDDILKYGLPIGKALADIGAGEWVHVHNCRSEHFGYHREKYGLKA